MFLRSVERVNRLAAISTRARGIASSASNPPAVGVAAALAYARGESKNPPRAAIFNEFSLKDRIGLVSGGNRGLGLEMALALAEAGARRVYCVDLPPVPGPEFAAAQTYVDALDSQLGREERRGESRMGYVSADVTEQERMWDLGREIGEKEGRMDVCVAAAGVLPAHYFQAQTATLQACKIDDALYAETGSGRR